MMTLTITCPECKSGIHVYANAAADAAQCAVCNHVVDLKFDQNHANNELHDCPVCQRKDFYIQKDFNRKIGVALFILASILSIWTYGISFIVLYAVDFFLFRKLSYIAICYKCSTIFRGPKNLLQIQPFDHEMHDRIVYSDHDFKGKSISH
ncbi:MAG: hypothetical protein JNM93_01350 [Bacteriovoracaceae bacterium]|nr:hypothetical protein [Bacteriovoracaceae bacterium]